VKQIEKVLIAGAGAIGSMVAGQLYRWKPDSVSILAAQERLMRYKKDGFIINEKKIDLPLTDARVPPKPGSEPDLVIIACKAHHLEQVIADLSNHIGPETLILSLLNGITSEATIAAAWGEWRIPYAMIIKTDAGHKGNRTTYTNTGIIFFGDTTNPSTNGRCGPNCSERVRRIATLFDRAGINYTVPADMLGRLWYKFMVNVGLNQVSAVLRIPYGPLTSSHRGEEATRLMEDAMREVVALARAEGITLCEGDIETLYPVLDALSPEGKTSMCQDVDAGRKTEVEIFAGTVLQLAELHGIPVPVNTMLFRLLRAIEESGRVCLC